MNGGGWALFLTLNGERTLACGQTWPTQEECFEGESGGDPATLNRWVEMTAEWCKQDYRSMNWQTADGMRHQVTLEEYLGVNNSPGPMMWGWVIAPCDDQDMNGGK